MMEFRKIAVVGLFSDARVAEPMQVLAGHLTKGGKDVMADPSIADELGVRAVDEASFADEADLLIAIGGDGTMLHAATLNQSAEVPILGINRGRLGFLADISPSDMIDGLEQIMSGNYTLESRLRLDATITSPDGDVRTATALNDVVLQRRETGRMLDFETRVAGTFVNMHMGDGLIVSTPTGSTAYALSCGGPIIEPQLDAVVVVPICPHTLSDRPIVVPADHEIDITLLERDDTKAEVSIDGHSIGEFTPEDQLRIARAEKRITLIHPPGYDYYDILRSKLHWGRDTRKRDRGASR